MIPGASASATAATYNQQNSKCDALWSVFEAQIWGNELG